MKRVGELYEVVVFTASVSKVRRPVLMSANITIADSSICSTVTLCSTNWIFIMLSIIAYSERAVTTTRGTTSRLVYSVTP